MRVLLTGYKGFIGQNMVKYLKENTDWHVVTYEWGEEFPGILDVDWVIHLGAISSTTERDLNKIMTQNNEFTNQLVNNCKRFGVNLQFASSASLYGSGSDFSETAQLDPVSPYAWSKYLSERHIERFGGNIIHTFRYFNVYGGWEDHKGSQASPVTQFRNQSKTDGKIKLFENSKNYRRDFICVTDICRIHVEFIKKVKSSGVFNVGTGIARSFQEVADLINTNQFYVPMPENLKRSYQSYTCSDNTKLESVLGPQKWVTIEEFLNSSKQ